MKSELGGVKVHRAMMQPHLVVKHDGGEADEAHRVQQVHELGAVERILGIQQHSRVNARG